MFIGLFPESAKKVELMAALVRVLMFCIMNMLMDVLFAFVIVGMFMLIVCMTAHFLFHLP
jgi:hypothetical protein